MRELNASDDLQISFAEIKPLSISGIAAGISQMAIYSSILSPARYSIDRWDTNQSINICGKPSYIKNIQGVIFYTNDNTIKSFVAEAVTLAMIADANSRSQKPSSGMVRGTQAATSLLNRASGISARYASNSVKAAIARYQSTRFSVFF